MTDPTPKIMKMSDAMVMTAFRRGNWSVSKYALGNALIFTLVRNTFETKFRFNLGPSWISSDLFGPGEAIEIQQARILFLEGLLQPLVSLLFLAQKDLHPADAGRRGITL